MAVLPLLGELEMAILEHLWLSGDTDVLHAHALVGAKRGISVNTIGSTLERLFKKGLVEREKVSHAYRYWAALDRDAFQARRLVQAAGGVETLAREGVLAAFVDLVADADSDALEELGRLVRQRRKERPR